MTGCEAGLEVLTWRQMLGNKCRVWVCLMPSLSWWWGWEWNTYWDWEYVFCRSRGLIESHYRRFRCLKSGPGLSTPNMLTHSPPWHFMPNRQTTAWSKIEGNLYFRFWKTSEPQGTFSCDELSHGGAWLYAVGFYGFVWWCNRSHILCSESESWDVLIMWFVPLAPVSVGLFLIKLSCLKLNLFFFFFFPLQYF